VLDELGGGPVVVDDVDAGLLEASLHRVGQLDDRAVLPQGPVLSGVEAHDPSDVCELVVAVGIAEVARADLGRDVPAAERREAVVEPADRERLVADGGVDVPPQAELGDAGVVRVGDVDLLDDVRRDLPQGRPAPGVADEEREDLELGALGPPAQRDGEVRETDVEGSPTTEPSGCRCRA